ncbi:glycoside hydrolase family 97 catalytic domain-containing protein [Paenibacillus sp. MWE-103]|uniref:Glycoside hydrolase family 97 catalytic domain-containing protein n=1 Tax=Paenibacillus artemisiicola TaxID=1172618 RepID=A0ABS3W8G6_9BACL|nr:glycoside hydrolase family 97 catalytic domain-containing protein [Paenibacillus artemisiicola]MBO7744578.1 glycoside hydrolase family 97 catalytic domain-containing protein [Paenibacillus artemisiicola]
MWTLDSPHRKLTLTVYQDADERLYYSLEAGDCAVLAPSRLGLATSLGDLLAGYRFIRREDARISERYSLPVGKKAVYENEANELTLRFEAAELAVAVRFRLFEDGLAFRYEVRAGGETSFRVYREYTDFAFPGTFGELWLQDWVNTYEGPYNRCGWQTAGTRDYGMPALLHSAEDGRWAMLTEAGILNTGGSYCSSHLQTEADGRMKLAFAPEQLEPMPAALPLETPWRIVTVCDDLDQLVNSTLNYNLNPPCERADTSWIKPARSIWSWWAFENGAQLYSEQKRYVDFAAAMGFEAITVDAGWDDSWVKDLCDYARERNVDVWLWSDMQAIDTPEKAQEKIPRWAAWGVVGLKVDFFMNDSRHTMWQYNMIADLMTAHRLMINFHGSTKPAGEGRTYPNIMTAEGILGLEHYKWSGLPHAAHNCTVPFTRNVVGPMDYTVTGFSNANRNTTQAHQLALAIVFESGVQHFADAIYAYEPWVGTELLRRLPAKFDGVRVLSGFPGDHAVLMRSAGREWFVGGIVTASRSVTVPLGFLPDGRYRVELYRDGRNGDLLKKEVRFLTNRDSLSVQALESGGFALYISAGEEAPPLKSGVRGGYMDADAHTYSSAAAELRGTADRVPRENALEGSAVALGSGGELVFGGVAADRTGRHSLRLFYLSARPSSLHVSVNGGEPQAFRLESSGGDEVVRTSDIVVTLEKGINAIVLARSGPNEPSPLIDRVNVIGWAPHPDTFYSAEEGMLAGGASLCHVDASAGLRKAVGIGRGGSLTFDGVMAEADGDYILTLDYYSGENRALLIAVNDEPSMRSVLFNTGGWGPARWDISGIKEVKIRLRKGANRIKLHHDEELAPEVGRIGVRLETPLEGKS